MDIPGLKAELEQHLKSHPHEECRGGFRDRFEQAVEHYEAETDAEDKTELEAQLRQICDNAEAAVNAACSKGGAAAETEPRGDAAGSDPVVAASGPAEAPAPQRFGKGRIGIMLAALAGAAAAAFYFYSGS